MIIAALLILGASLLFFAVVFAAVVFCIVLPMREKLAETQAELDELRGKQTEQEDTIARNAWATIGLYMVNRREINELSKSTYTFGQKLAYVESATGNAFDVDMAPVTEKRTTIEAPITSRSGR